MKCPKCKKEVADDSKSCPECGYNIENDEGKYRKLYIILPVLVLFIAVVIFTWYFLTMDKRMVYRVKDNLEKEGYTCTFEETKERAKVSKKYIFGTSEVADVHCYKEDGKKVYVYEMFFVDSYRYNFYVIEDKNYEKTEDTYIFRLSGLDYEITKEHIAECSKLKEAIPALAAATDVENAVSETEETRAEKDFKNKCRDYSDNSQKYLDIYTDFMEYNKIAVSSQHS